MDFNRDTKRNLKSGRNENLVLYSDRTTCWVGSVSVMMQRVVDKLYRQKVIHKNKLLGYSIDMICTRSIYFVVRLPTWMKIDEEGHKGHQRMETTVYENMTIPSKVCAAVVSCWLGSSPVLHSSTKMLVIQAALLSSQFWFYPS